MIKDIYILQHDLPIPSELEVRVIKKGQEFIPFNPAVYISNVGVEFTSQFVENNPEWFKKKEQPVKDHDVTIPKSKLDAMMETVFNASRLNHPMAGMKFDTFQDYYKSLPENQALNVEDKTVDAKEYEILSWNLPQFGGGIHSVKRLSDGEVFTIGDDVIVTFGINDKCRFRGAKKITGFKEGHNGGLIVLHDSGDSSLKQIKKE